MGFEQQRRKKKQRTTRGPPFSLSQYFSGRSSILCFCCCCFISIFFLRNGIWVGSASFRPVLIVSGLSRFSLSAINSNSIQDFSLHGLLPLTVEDRILFPDHILLLVSNKNPSSLLNLYQNKGLESLDCVYLQFFNDSGTVDEKGSRVILRPVLSMDEFDELRSIVRCPAPPANCSEVVNLQESGRKTQEINDGLVVVHSWDMVVYGAALDGDSAVVFVKGLNLRPDRESDHTQFSCHFGFGNLDNKASRFVLTSKAITAAQEVIRCSLPFVIQKNQDKAQGIRVTIGRDASPTSHLHLGLLPSVAKISYSNPEIKNKNKSKKHELCVCTMVWNQASSLREWIVYHAWLGVERWFIYDNNSDDPIKEAIDELEQEGYNVTRHVWPWIKTQEAGFSHCALKAKDECNWVGFMDVDEFFYFPLPTDHHPASSQLGYPGQDSLRSLVANFSSSNTIAEIRTACHSFGPSGLSSLPSQGVTGGYTCRLQSPERHKSIVQPDALDDTLLNVIHHFRLRKGYRYLNLPQSIAVINHYKYQVWEAFRAKFYRRVATYVADWQNNQNEGSKDRAPGLGTEAVEPPNWRLQFCEVWDTGLRDFVMANLADPMTGAMPWEERSPR